MKGYYHIHNTCPIIYDKTVGKIAKQLKKDKIDFMILEINRNEKHPQKCSEINYKGPLYRGHGRKLKGCLTCEYQHGGRNNSTKTTIICMDDKARGLI